MPIYGVFLAMTYKLSHSRKIALIASCALLFSLFGVIPARAQNTGIATVGPISYSVTQCNGTPQIITPPELGQSVHFVSYLATGAPTTLQVVSDQLNQSYWSTETAVNPAAGSYILETRNSNSSRSLYFDHVHLTSTVAVQLNVVFITNSGTGCSAGAPSIMVGANGSPSQATVDVTCTTNANTYGTGFPVFLAANSSYDLDLRGFIALANTTLGIGIQSPSAVTGQVSATTYWYEK